ncbi:MAG: hypothetical protein ACREDM_02900 [Methylocella sp.]
MKVITKIESWLWEIGADWDAKRALEKIIIAMIWILMAILAVMQFAIDSSQ